MFDFFRLRAGMVGVRGIKLPYTGLDLQGDTPQDVVLDPDMLHALAILYGIDSGGNARQVGVTPQGALQVADSGPQPEQVTYNYTQVVAPLEIVNQSKNVTGMMFRALGNGINLSLSYDGQNYPVTPILLYDRRVVNIRGAIVSFKLTVSSYATWYGPYLEYWTTRPAGFVPH